MQITIRFDSSLNRHSSFYNAMLKLAALYHPTPYRIGYDMGINVTDLSWGQCYELAANFIEVIRQRGIEAVDGIKITIGPDIPETSLPSHWVNQAET